MTRNDRTLAVGIDCGTSGCRAIAAVAPRECAAHGTASGLAKQPGAGQAACTALLVHKTLMEAH